MTELAQFPVIADDNTVWMWIFYTGCGLTLSLLLNKLYQLVKVKVSKPKTAQT